MPHSDYWRKREQDALSLYQKQEAEFDKEIERIYRAELHAIQREIEAWLKHLDKGGTTASYNKQTKKQERTFSNPVSWKYSFL